MFKYIMKRFSFAFIFLILFTFSSCSKASNEIMFMNSLKNDISKIYNIERVDIKIMDQNDIKISLIDSRFNNYSSEEKQKIAKQIGELVIELRKDMSKIKTGELTFTDESNYLIVKTSKTESFNLF